MFRLLGVIILRCSSHNLGKKFTIFQSNILTAIFRTINVLLPRYEKIGVTTAYTLARCKILQDMLSPTNIQGNRICLIKAIENLNYKCFLTSLISCITTISGFAVASLFIKLVNISTHAWKNIFCVVALVGGCACSSLKEMPEFADAKKRLKKTITELGSDVPSSHLLFKAGLNKKDILFLFVFKSWEVLSTFFVYTYCYSVKAFTKIRISNWQILNHSTHTSICGVFIPFSLLLLVFFFNPFKIVEFRFNELIVLSASAAILFHVFKSSLIILLAQIIMISYKINDNPASAIMYKKFLVLQRFIPVLIISALFSALIWSTNIYELLFLTDLLSRYLLYFIFIPIGILATKHFAETQKAAQFLQEETNTKINIQII